MPITWQAVVIPLGLMVGGGVVMSVITSINDRRRRKPDVETDVDAGE